MSNIIEILQSKPLFFSFGKLKHVDIEVYEKLIGLKFAPDYYEYVQTFGCVSYFGHELTGVCSDVHLDVANVTKLNKEFITVPSDWYVIEETHFDNIVFWQSTNGKIYKSQGNGNIKHAYNSLSEYLEAL